MPMILLIVANLINIVLDLLFVVVFKWDVSGVAFASLCADYVCLLVGVFIVYKMLTKSGGISLLSLPPIKSLISLSSLAPFLLLNRDIFIRSLCLQLTFAFMTIQGTKLGADIVSTNAVLMQFLMLIAFSMDGLAYAIEALVGKNVGAKNLKILKLSLYVTLFWGLIFSLLQVLFFYLGGDWIISQVTSIESIQKEAHIYLPWLILIPLTSMLGFIFDGVFIGMTRGKVMRNSMLFSVVTVYFPVWWVATMLLPESSSNHALWIAMNAFMLARGLSLSWSYFKLNQKNLLLG
jgi:MATE family multidrug resistance protein